MSFKKVLFAVFVSAALTSTPAWAGSVEDELMAVDRAFNKMAQEVGVGEAFIHYLSSDVRLLSEGGQPVLGHAAMAEAMAGFPASVTLEWDPVEAVASSSGDMGFTWGRFIRTHTDEEGNVHTSHGKYLSVWQKQEDGSWKASVDIGNGNPAPEE